MLCENQNEKRQKAQLIVGKIEIIRGLYFQIHTILIVLIGLIRQLLKRCFEREILHCEFKGETSDSLGMGQ